MIVSTDELHIKKIITGNLRTENILIDKKNYKDLTIHSKSMKMLSLHYHKLIGKTKEHKRTKYLMVNNYILDKILDKAKEIIGILKFDDTKILIKTDDKLRL